MHTFLAGCNIIVLVLVVAYNVSFGLFLWDHLKNWKTRDEELDKVLSQKLHDEVNQSEEAKKERIRLFMDKVVENAIHSHVELPSALRSNLAIIVGLTVFIIIVNISSIVELFK